MKSILLLGVLILLTTVNTWGQLHQNCSNNLIWNGSASQTFSTIPLEIPNDIHRKVNYSLADAKVRIRIAIEENGVFPYGKNDNFQFRFNLSGDVQDMQGNSALGTAFPTQQITLNANQPEVIFVTDLAKPAAPRAGTDDPFALNSNNTLFELVQLKLDNISNSGIQIPTQQLLIQVCYDFGIESAVGQSALNAINNPVMKVVKLMGMPTAVANSAYYRFQWQADHGNNKQFYAPYYEFQLLKLENTELDNPAHEHEIKTKEDWGKALSFVIPEAELTKTNGIYHFDFKPSEGTGYYLWRVRPIGTYYKGAVVNNQNWGVWNTPSYTNAAVTDPVTGDVSLQYMNVVTGLKDCFYYTDTDADNNYVYNRSFTEDGKVYENITYADRLLRTRQTQTYLPAKGKTLVGQSLYDHLGRSSISVIPVPVDGQMNGYKDDFVQTQNGDLYTSDHFAVDNKVYNPEKVSTTGAHGYYSPNNPDETIPDAEGYPFTRTLYSTDGLNRTIEESGIGKTHMVGTLAEGRGRTTKTNVQVSVHDAELVSVFGVEAPNSNHVSKKITTDPNGTTTVTYLSKSGKVLATALATPTTTGAYELEELDNSAINEVNLKESLNLGQYQTDRFVSSKELVLLQNVPVQFTYTAPNNGQGTLPACIGGATCSYEVVVKIYKLLMDPADHHFDLDANPDKIWKEIYASTPITIASGVTQTINPTSPLTLEKGTYKVEKQVKPLGNAVQAAIDAYLLQTENELTAYMSLIGLILDQVSSEQDWQQVENAATELHNYLTGVITLTALETNLNTMFPAVFAPNDFTGLTKHAVKDVVYTSNQVSTVDPTEVDVIKLVVKDCDGNDVDIVSEIENKKEKFTIGQLGPYVYNGTSYDYPPFVEYFLDEVGLDIYNDASQANTIFADFFEGYKYWSTTVNNWVAIDESFVTKYHNEMTSTHPSDQVLKVLNANQFNRMVWHMLNDEYYDQQVRFVASMAADNISGSDEYQYYDESSSTWKLFDNSIQKKQQYKVEELKVCWKNTFGGIKKMLAIKDDMLANAGSMLSNVDETIDNGAGAGTYEDAIDAHTPWLIKFFFGNELKDKLSNTSSDNPSGVQPNFAGISIKPVHLPKQFLECTGYRYARIVDPSFTGASNYGTYVGNLPAIKRHGTAANINFNTYDMPLMGASSLQASGGAYPSTYYGIPVYANEMAEYYGNNEYVGHSGNHVLHSFESFPFVENLVFAFKYYEYWGRNAAGSFTHPWHGKQDKAGNTLSVPNMLDKPISCLMCESEYAYDASTGSCSPSTFGHDQWPWQRRALFKECVAFISNDGEFPQTDDLVVSGSHIYINDQCNKLPTAEKTAMVDACSTNCENRRAEFRQEVIQMFENACYAVGQCVNQNTQYVTMAEIEAIVDQLVGECQNNCDLTINNAPVTCADIGGITVHYCKVQIGTDCELGKRDIAYNWKVKLFITPAPGCTNTVPTTGTPIPCPGGSLNETAVKEITTP